MHTGYPNEDQAAAICEYAAIHGDNWKEKLYTEWAVGTDHAALSGGHNGRGYLLRQVRNQFGPSWMAHAVFVKGDIPVFNIAIVSHDHPLLNTIIEVYLEAGSGIAVDYENSIQDKDVFRERYIDYMQVLEMNLP